MEDRPPIVEPATRELERVLALFNRNLRTYGVRVGLARVDRGTVELRVDRSLGAGVCSSGCDIPLPALLLALERQLGAVQGVDALRWTPGLSPP